MSACTVIIDELMADLTKHTNKHVAQSSKDYTRGLHSSVIGSILITANIIEGLWPSWVRRVRSSLSARDLLIKYALSHSIS